MKVKKKTIVIIPLIIILILLGAGYLLYKSTPLGRYFQLTTLSNTVEKLNRDRVRNYDVLHYNLFIDISIVEEEISGKAVLKIFCSDSELTLDFYDNMDIGLLTVNSIPAEYEHDKNLLTINLPSHENDTTTIIIEYEGTPELHGLGSFNFDYYNGKPFVYTLNEPVYAPTWFPCNDMPDDKATYDISIAAEPGLVSLSNGILVDEYKENDKQVYHWRTYYPTSTYLVCFYTAEYVRFTQDYISLNATDTMQIDYYVTPDLLDDAKKEFEDHPKYINVLASIFGEYPFINEKYAVAQFLWSYGAMEHQTITGIGANFISGRKFSRDILIHEIAHHWWGNSVGPKSWKDIWLNEGFSSYAEALYYEKVSGKDALTSTMISKRREFTDTKLYDPEGNIFTKTVYDKGAWVLHMLRYELGDDLFFKILREYYKRFAYGNASTQDFKIICEEISGKNLDSFFDQWVYKGKGIIEAQYNWIQTLEQNGKYYVELKIKQVSKYYELYEFPLEVELVTSNKENIKKRFFVDEKEETFELNSKYEIISIKIDPEFRLLADIYEFRN